MATPPGPYYLVEWYRTELSAEEVDTSTAALQAAAATLTTDDARVSVLSVIAAPTDDLLFALFAANGAYLVAQTCMAAGISMDRLTVGVHARILT